MPPSTPYLDKLALGQGVSPTPLLLHSLVWGPRAGHKTFISWMKVKLLICISLVWKDLLYTTVPLVWLIILQLGYASRAL